MKRRLNGVFKGLLAFGLAFGSFAGVAQNAPAALVQAATLPTTNRDDAPQEVKDAVSRMIAAYGEGDHQEVAAQLEKLKEISPNEWHPIYVDVISYWDWIENSMVENTGVAPDGLEDPAHHCFITLGFALNNDGTMTPELVGRLEVTLASLQKYPEAKVLVTGGVEKNGWTEGQRMHDWLVEHGIDESRIFVEKQAPDTAGNATYSFDILYNDGNIKSVSLISSQYHIKRGSILYYTESRLKAKELGKDPITFDGNMNAGWLREDKTSEPMAMKANSMYSIVRVPKYVATDPDDDTKVTGLDVIFPNGKKIVQGGALNCTVKTIDTKGQNMTVTDQCKFDGFDPNKIGKQSVMVTYTHNGEQVHAAFEVEVVYPEFKNALAEAVKKAADYKETEYTPETYKALQVALESANKVLGDGKATEEQVKTAQDTLDKAVKALKKVTPAPSVQKFKVTFKGKDGKVISTQEVEKGKGAKAPAAPAVSGMVFDKWDKDFSNVQSDLTVTALYKKATTKAGGSDTAVGGTSFMAALFGASALSLSAAWRRMRKGR